MQKLSLLSALCFLLCASSSAQIAETFLGDSGKDHIAQMIPTPEGNFLATGTKTVGNYKRIWLLKFSQSGSLIWEKTYDQTEPQLDGYGHGLTLLANGDIIITGENRSNVPFMDGTGIVIRTTADGDQIWQRGYPETDAFFDALPIGNQIMLAGGHTSGFVMLINGSIGSFLWRSEIDVYSPTKVHRIFQSSDGNYLLVGRTNVTGAGFQGVFVRKITPSGNLIWQQTHDTFWRETSYFYDPDYYNQSLGAALMPDGTLWVTNPYSSQSDVTLLQFSADGALLQQKNYGDLTRKEMPYGLTVFPDGSMLIAGESTTTNASVIEYQGFAMFLDEKGAEIWRRYYGQEGVNEKLFGGVRRDDGQFILFGRSNNPAGNGDNDAWLLQTEADGNMLPWTIEGQVVLDLNNNCVADANEPVAKSWFLEVTGAVSELHSTDEQGRFKIRTGDGTTTLTALAPDPGTWQFCNISQTIVSSSSNPVAQLTFLAQATDGGCPQTEVGITQPDLQRCSTSTFLVTVQNRGSGESGELMLNLVADPALSILSVSEPYIQQGNSITIDIDPMGFFQQKTIEVVTNLACDVQIGATHGIVARLMPVECATSWDGPRFAVEGLCSGDQVSFNLKNEGAGGPNATSRYRVMADDLLNQDWAQVNLPEGAAPHVLEFPADGRTWRVELEQSPGFPSASRPAVSIENCGLGENGLHSIGFSNAWYFDDGVPEIAAAHSPNTTGVPQKVVEGLQGFGSNNLVGAEPWLEYTARARNPLQTTVQSAEFRFTFSPNLDVRTFKVLASNGPVELTFDHNSVLKATMRNIHVDSGGYAMLRFRIYPHVGGPADSGPASRYIAYSDVYFNGFGPYALAQGLNNYSITYPLESDPINNYPPGVLLFGGRNSDFGIFMASAPDGSVFLGGSTSSYSSRTNTDGLLIKTNADGRAYWLNAIDLGDQGSNSFEGLVALDDGGCVVVGNFRPRTATDNYLSSYTPYFARMDASGRMLWHKKFRPAGPQFGAWTNNVIGTSNGNFIVFGYTENDNNGIDQYYLIIDENGNVVWQQYEEIIGSAFRPTNAVQTADGGTVFIGTNESTVVNFDVYLEKIDLNGNILWSKGYNSSKGIFLTGMAPMPDGGFLASGYSQWEIATGVSGITPTFIRFSPEGDAEWEKSPVVGPYEFAFANNIIPAPNGGYFSVGQAFGLDDFEDDYMLLKLDENADIVWWRNYGSDNSEGARAALVSSPDQILLWGNNQPRPPLNDLQGVLIRTDIDGNLYVGTEPELIAPLANVTVFPNPANAYLNVHIQHAQEHNIRWQLSDISGLPIRKGVSSNEKFDINLGGLPSGMYFLAFPEQGIPTKRVVVLR